MYFQFLALDTNIKTNQLLNILRHIIRALMFISVSCFPVVFPHPILFSALSERVSSNLSECIAWRCLIFWLISQWYFQIQFSSLMCHFALRTQWPSQYVSTLVYRDKLTQAHLFSSKEAVRCYPGQPSDEVDLIHFRVWERCVTWAQPVGYPGLSLIDQVVCDYVREEPSQGLHLLKYFWYKYKYTMTIQITNYIQTSINWTCTYMLVRQDESWRWLLTNLFYNRFYFFLKNSLFASPMPFFNSAWNLSLKLDVPL